MPNGKRGADGPSEQNRGGESRSKPAKRSRVSRACDQCRASRERCDGEAKCQTCLAQNRSCTYNAQPKKRGIQPNYIRTLELTLAWLLQTFPEAESQLAESIPSDYRPITALLRGKDPEASETLHLAWRNSVVCKQIDQLLSGEAVDTDGEFLANRDDVDDANSGAIAGASQLPSVPFANEQNAAQHHLINIAASLGASNPARQSGGPPDLDSHYELIQLPENVLTLVEHYFAFTHSWLPMTEKSSMLKLVYSYPREGLAQEQLTGAEHAELWSIMALAATQLSEDSQQAYNRRIREVAEGMIPAVDSNSSFQVPHIRALMNLALMDVYAERMLAAWLRIGTVVSLLLLFRILEKLDVTEKWCIHIHLAAFVIETAIALHLRVPAHLEISYIDTIGFVNEDGLEEWATWQDPDNAPHHNQTRGPARSFSTLNELVRRSVGWRKDFVAYSPGTGDEEDKSVVFTLLRNGSKNNGRFQPSMFVASLAKQGQNPIVATNRLPNHDSIRSSSQVDQGPVNIDQAHYQDPTMHDSPGLYRFMSIPNDINAANFTEAGNSSAGDQTAPALWMTSPAASQTADFSSMLGDGSVPGTDIFEQFDALIEHQDSNQQSQFYQNLGFAPDVELAEFFGSDYQPSDPLLAYLNPALYGMNQGADPTVSGLS